MKHTFYILFFFCTWGIQANTTPTIDSLQYVVKNEKGQKKLKDLQQILSTGYRVDIPFHYLDEFIKESKKQSNYLFLATAYQYKSDYFRYSGELDSMRIYAEKGLEELDRVNKKDIRLEEKKNLYNSVTFHCYELLAKYYSRFNQFHMVQGVIEQMLEKSRREKNVILEADAYYLMSLLRMALEDYEPGLQSLEKSLALENTRVERRISGHIMKQSFYMAMEQYDELLTLTDTMENYITNNYITNESDIATIYYHTAHAYTKLRDLPKAREYIDKASKSLFLDGDSVHPYLLNADYYIAANNNVQALKEVNIALANSKNHPPLNILASKEMKATILRNLGRNGEAYDLLEEVSEENYAIMKNGTVEQIAELETLYRVDKLKSDLLLKDSKLHSSRLLLGGSILITLLVIAVVVVVWRANKKLRERNLDLYKRHKKLEELTEGVKCADSQLIAVNNQLDANDIIMNKLDCYMRETKAFLDSEITRDSLAMQIGTNRQYLVTGIKEKRDQTFNEYIYMWRLKHAYNLIIRNRDVPISEIFLESGFSSQSVFNREFKKSYGMTPSELRTAAEEEEEKSKNTRE